MRNMMIAAAIAVTPMINQEEKEMNALIFGSGEYVSGYTGTESVNSDKSMGVVGPVFFGNVSLILHFCIMHMKRCNDRFTTKRTCWLKNWHLRH